MESKTYRKARPVNIFFRPESIAVIGASENPKKGGNIIIKNLIDFGYTGSIYPINPRGGKIHGLDVYDSVRSVPNKIDLVMIVIPRHRVRDAVLECGEKGVRGVIISTAGFSDSGDDVGRGLEKEIVEIAARYNIRVMGPNSIGTINVEDGFVTSITSLEKPRAGNVSFFGQTGMFASGFFRWIASSQNFSIAKVACLGNKCDVNETDVLAYLGGDPQTGVIGMYVEGITDGRSFFEVAREVATKKPIIALKSGRTEWGRATISSHTGSIAGDDAIFDGVSKSSGIIRVPDFDHFYDALKTFSFLPLPRSNRIGIVSITGVGCVLAVDHVQDAGLSILPLSETTKKEIQTVFPDWAQVKNPVDMWFAIENVGPQRAYEVITRALMRDEEIDIILTIFTLIPESEFDAARVFEQIRDENPEKPVLACFMGGERSMFSRWYAAFEERKIPVFSDPGRMVRAAGAIAGYANFLKNTKKR